MSDSFEQLRRKEVELQAKQLTAQRIIAAAAVANAAATAHQAATIRSMQQDLNDAARATAKHQRDMAEQQRLMAEEQRLSNFRNTILTTLPLLKEEEKAQYLTEQLLPRIKGAGKTRTDFAALPLSKLFENSGLIQFASGYTQAHPTVKEFFVTGKPLVKERLNLQALQAECMAKNNELKTIEKEDPIEEFKAESVSTGCGCAVAIVVFLVTFSVLAKLADSVLDTWMGWIVILLAIGASSVGYKLFIIAANEKNKMKQEERQKRKGEYQKNKQLRLEAVKNDLDAIQHKINSFASHENLKANDALWEEVKAGFVDSFLASVAGKEFAGERGGYKMLLAMSSPWRELVAEEQAFLPPSVRLPFVECWLPLLLKEDDFLDAVFVILKNFQSQLKTFLLELVEPDYESQTIAMNRELLSESFYKVVSERKYLSSGS